MLAVARVDTGFPGLGTPASRSSATPRGESGCANATAAALTSSRTHVILNGVEALLLLILAPSFFGIPGALAGWLAGRRSWRTLWILAGIFILTLLAVVIVGFSSSDDAFDAVAIGVLVVIVWLNACTAIGGAALARHAQNRDAHLA